MKGKQVYLYTFESESSDLYGPFVFENKPDEDTLKELVKTLDYDPDCPGQGLYGSYIYIAFEGWATIQ